ncbi:hypothetical protein GCM10027516_06010 [Niabella aquatica]
MVFEDSMDNERLNYISLLICQYFFGTHYNSIKRLKSDLRQIHVGWSEIRSTQNGQETVKQKSHPINYRIIKRHLQKNFTYNHQELNLPELASLWMDRSVNAAMNFYCKNGEDEISLNDGLLRQQYGTDFPLSPKLNQEGFLITSFLELITKRIFNNRIFLVRNSHHFFTSDWLFTLKDTINDIISLVDITLNQLYLKALYNKKQEWCFDVDSLGKRQGVRLMDKLKWVKLITGQNLNIEKEITSLDKLREIRNHLNHFDPPSFVATLNEIVDWLNEIFNIVKIVIRIRLCAGEMINKNLIQLFLQANIVFRPYTPRGENMNKSNFGYNSVRYFRDNLT